MILELDTKTNTHSRQSPVWTPPEAPPLLLAFPPSPHIVQEPERPLLPIGWNGSVRATLFVSHLQRAGAVYKHWIFFQCTQNAQLADREEIFAEF